MKVLLGVTGSIAAKLTLKLQETIEKNGWELHTVVTNSAIKIGDGEEPGDPDWRYYHNDEDEWNDYHYNEEVLHIELTKWADIFVIAPCTANTLAKIANGIADNLLTNCALAWGNAKPIILAPAMNTKMWNNGATERNVKNFHLNYMGHSEIIEPVAKKLYCGDEGIGAMCQIDTIIERLNHYSNSLKTKLK